MIKIIFVVKKTVKETGEAVSNSNIINKTNNDNGLLDGKICLLLNRI